MLIELGYEFAEDIPIFPGLPEEKVLPHTRMSRGEESNTTMLHHFLHNGTHVDAPYHFWNHGETIDKIPIDHFLYERPLLIEKELKKGELFSLDDIQRYGGGLKRCDILLLCTGYWKVRGDKEKYSDDFPAVSEEAARFIRKDLLQVKAVAIDTLSIENPISGPKANFKVHKTFLDGDLHKTRPVLIYEDVNLGKILNKKLKRIYAFPLRFRGLDASPVNMVAEI